MAFLHLILKTDTSDVLSFIYQCVLERNASETEQYLSVFSSNLALQNTVDNLQYQCTVLQKEKAGQDRIIDQLTEELDANNGGEGGGSGGGKGGPSKTEARQREKIEKLQEQLNDKLRAEVESSASALKVANELAELKDTNAENLKTIQTMKEEQSRTDKMITQLNAELTDAKSTANLAEKQYEGLKDTIRTLQEENDELKRTNSDLVNRVVSEKEKSIDEINKMNESCERLQKEVEMLREYQKQQEKRARGGPSRMDGTRVEGWISVVMARLKVQLQALWMKRRRVLDSLVRLASSFRLNRCTSFKLTAKRPRQSDTMGQGLT